MYTMYRVSNGARILPFTTLQLSVARNFPLRIGSFEGHLNACRHVDHGWISCLESRAATSNYKAILRNSCYYFIVDVSVLVFSKCENPG